MDQQKFGKIVQELLRRKGIRQNELADALGLNAGYLSQILMGKKPLQPHVARSCILFLAREAAIREQKYVDDLLEWAGCEDFSPTDWATWPLSNIARSIADDLHDPTPQPWMLPSDSSYKETIRQKYLEQVIRWHTFFTLPVGSQQAFALQNVFQPLRLRRGRFLAEDLSYEDRRALLDEPTRSEDDPRWAGSGNGVASFQAEEWREATGNRAINGWDALNKSPQRCMVVLGPPGIGKTTLLKHLLVEMARKAQANPNERIPLFISLPEFVRAGMSLQAYLPRVTGMLGVDTRYVAELWQAIEKGKAFVCLDMLEQVPPERRRDLLAWINVQIVEPGNSCIVSSRFNEYNGGLFTQGFIEWEVCPLTRQSREPLAQALFRLFSQTSGNDTAPFVDPSGFVAALEEHTHAVNWGRNPLLFSLTASIFARTGKIPSSRAALYQETMVALLAARQQDRNRQTALRMIIASLALQLYKERQRLLTREELVERVATLSISQQEIPATEHAQRIIDSGILEIVAKDLYGFWHQTFQEYFTAVELARCLISQKTRQDVWEFIWQKHTSSRWTEVLRLMAGTLLHEYGAQGGVEIARSWLKALVERGIRTQGDISDLGLALAIYTLSDIGEVAPLWPDPAWMQLEEMVVKTWIEALRDATEHDHVIRKRRLLQLVLDICLLKPSTIALLVQLLESDLSSWDVRRRVAVVEALGRLGAYASVELLIGRLGDLHPDVQAVAVQALVHMEEHVPVEALRGALRHQKVSMRENATRVLGAIKRPLLVEELTNNVHDEAWEVRLATVEALGNLGEAISLETLLAGLHDENTLVRCAAVEALGKRRKDVPQDVFLMALDDDDSGVRGAAIEALGEQTPVEKLIEEVFAPPVVTFLSLEYARRAAKAVLAKRGEQEALKEIIAAGIPDSPELREQVRTMVASQQEASQDELLEGLRDNHPETRKQAANILSRKDPALLEHVVTSQETRQVVMHAIAVRMVGRLGEPTLVKVALQGLHDADAKIRLAALLALRDLGEQVPTEAGGAVADLIEDEDWWIRTEALQVLLSLTEQVSVTLPLLESLLILTATEKYTPARDAAAQCIEKVGRDIPQELVDELLHHEEQEIRAMTLQQLWPYLPLRQIQEALSDDDEDVRAAAVTAERRRKAQQAKKGTFQTRTKYQQQTLISLEIERMPEVQLVKKLCGEDVLRQVVTWREVTSEDFNNWKPQLWQGSGLGGEPLVVMEKDKRTDPVTQAYLDLEDDVHNQLMHLLKTRAPVDKLLESLDDEHPDVRLAALQALEERAPEERLLTALHDEDPFVRKEALQRLDVRVPQKQLFYALRDTFDIVRDVALAILSKLVQQLSETELLEALESEDAIMRHSAIQALGTRAPVKKLLATLGDSSEEVRLAALDQLLRGYPETRHRLVSEVTKVLLHQQASMIIESAAHSFLLEIISQMEEPIRPSIYNRLMELLDWPHWEVQMKAAQILGTLHQNIPAEIVERLLALRKEAGSRTVRVAADDALAELLSLERGFEVSA